MTKWRFVSEENTEEWRLDGSEPFYDNEDDNGKPTSSSGIQVKVFPDGRPTELWIDLCGHEFSRDDLIAFRDDIQAIIDKLDEITKG